MIKYRLACPAGHEFEGWFQSSDAYDKQAARGQVLCPVCGSAEVSKAVMAPSLATRSAKSRGARSRAQALDLMRKLRADVEQRAEYVGPRFAEEARKIHEDGTVPRGIYGEATPQDARALIEDGVPVLPLPRLPEDEN